jgi:uncharacterized membrane protein YfcA
LIAALGIGISLGLLGGGGSILTVPALVYWAGLPPFEATSASLVVVGLTSVSGAVQHARFGNVRLREALLIAASGVPASLAGSLLSRRIPEHRLMLLFAGVMVAAGLSMLLQPRYQPDQQTSWPRVLAAGAFVGLVTGFFGIGGGFLVVPTLVVFARLPMPCAVGTSLAVIAFNCLAGFSARIGIGAVQWLVTLAFSAVAIAGSAVGTALARRLSAASLRRSFGVFVLGVAAFVFARNLGG